MMPGVKDYNPQLSFINTVPYLFHKPVINFSVRHMSPPKENVGVVQQIIGKPSIWVIKSSKCDVEIIIFLKKISDTCVNTLRINLGNRRVIFFVSELVPDYNIYFFDIIFEPPKKFPF